jgi:hypothetical protein
MTRLADRTIWFFGASWPAGAELGRFRGGNDWTPDPNLSYPAIVGKDYNIKNLSVIASSAPSFIEIFYDNNIQQNDICIYCLPPRTRRLFKDARNNIVEERHPYKWVSSTTYEDERIMAQTCALLYYITINRNAIPIFLNEIDVCQHNEEVYKEIPDENWLLPKSQSILNIFDPEWAENKKPNDHLLHYWLDTNSKAVLKYIKPCEAHPNLEGHKKIAETIIERLQCL